ncbi:MAG TPA: DUF4290 domain-containing protein [Crocinitomix sp.]|nr:DUF4290 domain-containing protein [Crocinitomix sp.]
MEYNTARPKMLIPEYGRNVQKMVDFAVTIADKEERNKVANAIINVMGELKQHLRDDEDYRHKLWTHLFIMSDFKLDVDSPYPIPKKENINIKPNKMPYPKNTIKFGHYGKSVEKLIEVAMGITDGKEKIALIKVIANMMKKFHLMYHTNSIDESVIMLHLEKLSEGELKLDDLSFFTDTRDILKVVGTNRSSNRNNRNSKTNKNRNKNNRNRKRY